MEATPGVIKRLLRNLYHPVALRRDALATAIRFLRRPGAAARPFDEADVSNVQHYILWCVAMLDAERHTARGAQQRLRQRTIVERYDVGGQPRERIAAELGISLRQFYRERHVALQAIADSVSDAIRAAVRDSGSTSDDARAAQDIGGARRGDDAAY